MASGLRRSAWLAPLGVLGATGAAFGLVQTGSPEVAGRAVFPYAVALVLGPSLVYPWVRAAGASGALATAAALVTPLLWLVKECLRVGRIYSPAETLFYAANPVSLGLFVGVALQLAIAELWVGRRLPGRRGATVLPAAVLVGVGLLAAGFAVVALRHGPDVVFYAYIALYRRLFGA